MHKLLYVIQYTLKIINILSTFIVRHFKTRNLAVLHNNKYKYTKCPILLENSVSKIIENPL